MHSGLCFFVRQKLEHAKSAQGHDPSHITEHIGRFRCRWLRPFQAPGKTTAIILPGGPGLAPEYMLPWARRFARRRGLNLALIEYPVISDGEAIPPAQKYELYKDALLALFKRIAGDFPPDPDRTQFRMPRLAGPPGLARS